MENNYKNNSTLIPILMKTSVFSVVPPKQWNKSDIIKREINVFGSNITIEGRLLSLEKDLPLFLFIMSKGERQIRFKIKDSFDWIGKGSRLDTPTKSSMRRSLSRLKNTNFTVESGEDISEFNLISSYYLHYDANEVEVTISDNILSLYKHSKFKRYFYAEQIEGLSQYEKGVLLYISSVSNGNIRVGLDKLKISMIATNITDANFKFRLKKALNKLVENNIIRDFNITKDNILVINRRKKKEKAQTIREKYDIPEEMFEINGLNDDYSDFPDVNY
tara:strand:+ start:1691 stop:2518 length:828 start_codon:yes stop_codon:yes gene_type:complete